MSGMSRIALVLAVVASFSIQSFAQKSSTAQSSEPLVQTGAIPMPGVAGRIDHFGFDPENRVFVSALGSDRIEVIDLSAQKVVHEITGVPRPQGVVYSPETKKLFAGSDEGKLYIYDGSSFDLLATIEFGDDVDNLRYDASEKRVYAGFGDEQTGAIAMIDATTNQRMPEEFKLGAHPESFQLERNGPNIYVNLPELKQVAVVNRKTHVVARWALKVGGNFPMALDEANHRLFVASRSPARLLVFDTTSGRIVAELPCVQDSDDLYFDAARKRIYATGGEGYISVFRQSDPDHYSLLTKIRTAVGARTAGYSGKVGKKGFDRLYVAVPASAKSGAEVQIYTVQD
jgi:DNA-binding beta-propeller fold protein YncE